MKNVQNVIEKKRKKKTQRNSMLNASNTSQIDTLHTHIPFSPLPPQSLHFQHSTESFELLIRCKYIWIDQSNCINRKVISLWKKKWQQSYVEQRTHTNIITHTHTQIQMNTTQKRKMKNEDEESPPKQTNKKMWYFLDLSDQTSFLEKL